VLAPAADEEALAVNALDEMDEPVFFFNEEEQRVEQALSSAAFGDALPCADPFDPSCVPEPAIETVDGRVILQCIDLGIAPEDVAATMDLPDRVEIEWAALSGGPFEYEYRVYRSTQPDLNTALPLDRAWTDQTRYVDLTAIAPLETVAPGCARPPEFDNVLHYYWVRGRAADTKCPTQFSAGPVQGFRAAAE